MRFSFSREHIRHTAQIRALLPLLGILLALLLHERALLLLRCSALLRCPREPSLLAHRDAAKPVEQLKKQGSLVTCACGGVQPFETVINFGLCDAGQGE